MPGAIGATNSAARHDVVDVGMVLKSSSPGVEHAEEAWEIGTDVFGISDELVDRRRGRLKQSRVPDTLVLANEGTQLFGDCKGDQEMMSWQLALDLSLEPLLRFTVLACRTVAIATGAKELARLSAAVALVERHPAGLGATRRDGIDDFAVSFGHHRGVTLEVLGSEGCEDFTDGGHDRVPPSRG
jgi:hypothetical protein